MAAKHLNSKLITNFSVQNDRHGDSFLFSYPTTSSSKLSQNIHFMYYCNMVNHNCMFFSIVFSFQQNPNEHLASCPI